MNDDGVTSTVHMEGCVIRPGGSRQVLGRGQPAVDGAPAPGAAGEPAEIASFASVLANGEYRSMWLAQLLSIAGDQLARVAMAVLVYDRTRSALLTALTYAVTFLPWILGGVGLAGLADRLPRREVMIAADCARMVLVGVMATLAVTRSGAGLAVMVALLFLVTLLDSPFKSARAALVADILTGAKYAIGTAITQITLQTGMVAGFALGGVAVAGLGARSALVADAVTFAASAILLGTGVRRRPAAASTATGGSSHLSGILAGVRLVFGDRKLRILVLLGWLVGFYAAPMALAAPYAARFHQLPLAVATGLMFAGIPLGTMAGAAVFSRFLRPARQRRLMAPLAVAACAVLTLFWTAPDFGTSLVLFAVAGVCACYQVAANAAFVAAVPAAHRGQAFGLANGGMQVTQGLWYIAVGAMASQVSPATVIGLSGGLGTVLALGLAISWRRVSAAAPRPA